jgi:DUF971 family protein
MGLLDRIALTKHTALPPEAIDVTSAAELLLTWPGGQRSTITSRLLRERCPCAECIEEFTGKKLLDPASIPADIHPSQISPVGNYAIQITWSDGHSTGLYTWQTLRDVAGVA